MHTYAFKHSCTNDSQNDPTTHAMRHMPIQLLYGARAAASAPEQKLARLGLKASARYRFQNVKSNRWKPYPHPMGAVLQ